MNKQREIKFRVWNPVTKNWDSQLNMICVGGDRRRRYVSPDPSDISIVQQYTGIKTPSGREIYEGDIVKTVSRYSDSTYTKTALVKWDGEGQWNISTRLSSENYEILGNIFENPELLENFEQ